MKTLNRMILAVLALAPLAALAQVAETVYPAPGGGSTTVGGLEIPFAAVLPVLALASFLATEWLPGIEGKGKPLFLGAASSVLAVLATSVFDLSYTEAFAVISSVLAGNWVNSMAKMVPSIESMVKKKPNAP